VRKAVVCQTICVIDAVEDAILGTFKIESDKDLQLQYNTHELGSLPFFPQLQKPDLLIGKFEYRFLDHQATTERMTVLINFVLLFTTGILSMPASLKYLWHVYGTKPSSSSSLPLPRKSSTRFRLHIHRCRLVFRVYLLVLVQQHSTRKCGLLERDICVILRTCAEALVRFHALGGDACLRGKSVCLAKMPSSNVNYRDIAEAE
jgi:hypothetical protein